MQSHLLTFSSFGLAFSFLKLIRKGQVKRSANHFVWTFKGDLSAGEIALIKKTNSPDNALNSLKDKIINSGGYNWCLPSTKFNRLEQFSAVETFVHNLNKEQFLGFTDWRLPSIFELSRFEDSKIARQLESINTKFWTRHSFDRVEKLGVFGQLMTTKKEEQSYTDGRIAWSSEGYYAGFEKSYYGNSGQVILVRGGIYKPTNSWCERLIKWAYQNGIYEVGPSEESLQFVKELSFGTTDVIPEFRYFTNLEKLKLFSLHSLSDSIFELRKLQSLQVCGGRLRPKQTNSLNKEVANLSNLIEMNITNCDLNNIHPNLFKLSKLRHLNLSDNKLTQIPDEFHSLENLKYLDLSGNPLEKIPDSIYRLKNLEFLNLSSTKLSQLPPDISGLSGLRELRLRNNPLSELPESLKKLNNLITLNLGNTEVESLPEWITQLQELKTLILSKSKIRELYSFISRCPKLERITIHCGDEGDFLICPTIEAKGININLERI